MGSWRAVDGLVVSRAGHIVQIYREAAHTQRKAICFKIHHLFPSNTTRTIVIQKRTLMFETQKASTGITHMRIEEKFHVMLTLRARSKGTMQKARSKGTFKRHQAPSFKLPMQTKKSRYQKSLA